MSTLALVPAYQAVRTVASVVQDLLARFPADPGVLVVDDGSSDGTAEAAERAGARIVRHRHNRGKGAALRTGLAWAHRWGLDCVVTLDADGQHPAEEAWRLAQHAASRATLLLGVRDLRAAGAPSNSQFSNWVSNSFLSRFSGTQLLDTQCGLRRYPVAETLALGAWADGFAYEAEIVLRAARAGLRVEQLPVRVWYPPSDQRLSHFHVVRDPTRIVLTVLSTLATTARTQGSAPAPAVTG